MTEPLSNPATVSSPAPVSNPFDFTRSPILKKLYNHNPFYAISAALMLYSVRSIHGELEIGEIDSWLMLGSLGGYTLVLAIAGWLIVRFGKVWEDARSIVVILLFLFLAISVSMDDLFVSVESATNGTYLLLAGYFFSAVLSELFLYGTKIELKVLYRIPYHLILALLFIAPWFYSPQQNPRFSIQLEWLLFSFSLVSGLIFFSLYPAVRKGADYVKRNGTPWKYPAFPAVIFGTLALLIIFRSYLLCMAYGPIGPIWHGSGSSRTIVYNSIWGIYFLLPMFVAILFLVLEYACQTDNKKLANKTLYALPILFLMSLKTGAGFGSVSRRFYESVVTEYGSPVWVISWVVVLFCAWFWYRKVPAAIYALSVSIVASCFISPNTTSLSTLTHPSIWSLVLIGLFALYKGVKTHSSWWCTMAANILGLAVYMAVDDSISNKYQLGMVCQLMFISFGAISLIYADSFAKCLRGVVAILGVVFFGFALFSMTASDTEYYLKMVYEAFLVASFLAIGIVYRSKSFVIGFAIMVLLSGYSMTAVGYHALTRSYGSSSVITFMSSVGTLLLALLISSHKAYLMPKRFSKEATQPKS